MNLPVDASNGSVSLRSVVCAELDHAHHACRTGKLDDAFAHFERAHVLGQRLTWLHVRAHVGMLRIGWMRRDIREVAGQLTRIVAAAVFSRIWVPSGNTGGANVPAMRPMPIPDELRAILSRDASPR
jgi:Protein of unknown function (DUF3703)